MIGVLFVKIFDGDMVEVGITNGIPSPKDRISGKSRNDMTYDTESRRNSSASDFSTLASSLFIKVDNRPSPW